MTVYLGLDDALAKLDDLEANLSITEDDIAAVDHHWHTRWRVYPQDITAIVTVQSAAVVNTFGDWVLVVPLNTVPFDFDIIGVVIERITVATRYHIQIGHNTLNAEPGANQELGERRFRQATVPKARATELLDIRSQEVPANSTVWARIKTEAGGSEEVEISVVIGRHIPVLHEVPIYPAFPW